MARIPAGTARRVCPAFWGDCLYGRAGEASLGAFYIDTTEVTVAEYRGCVASGACTEPALEDERGVSNWALPARDRHPVNAVTYHQAAAYCSWVGKRLPNLYEWERAARGDDERAYPWGDEAPTCALAHIEERPGEPGCGTGTTAEVGSYPAGQSAYGLLDMTGNVAEWTMDPFAPDYSQTLVYGGGYEVETPSQLYISLPLANPKTWAHLGVGFRCAYAPGD
jgi:formylglycine-generating enzyme required for sulfatase activity